MRAFLILTFLLSSFLTKSIHGQALLSENSSVEKLASNTLDSTQRDAVRSVKIAMRSTLEDTTPLVIYIPTVPTDQSDSTLWLLDDQKISSSFLKMIDPEKLERIDVGKEGVHFNGQKYNSIVSIATKPNYNPKIITLSDLGLKHLEELNSEMIIYLVNGDPVTEAYENYILDDKFILKIEVYEKELNDGKLVIPVVNILTRTKDNLKKEYQIRIRGESKI
jgi:hypothetical protein